MQIALSICIAHEDHAARACYATFVLQEDLRRYANELRLVKGISFSVRVGLNSGEVVVGRIDDDLRMDGPHRERRGADGADRGAGQAYLTEYTARIVDGRFALHDLGELTVKGVKEPVCVYELQGLGRLRSRLEVSQARGFSKFVVPASSTTRAGWRGA